jgi:beta-lactamase class D
MFRKILLLVSIISSVALTQSIKEVDLSDLFSDMDGTFIMFYPGEDSLVIYNMERVNKAFLPASTFKIPNTVIGLEEGILRDDDTVIEWDSNEVSWENRWPEGWKEGQTLESAFRNSVVPYYQRLAKRIGEERMQKWLNHFNYGNKNIGGGIDQFWLNGEIRISPMEQVYFLNRLFRGDFRVSDSTLKTLHRIMNIKHSEEFNIFGKTGTAALSDKVYLAWLVGFIEKEELRIYYALNIEGETVWQNWPPHKRVDLVEKIVKTVMNPLR